MHLFLFLFSFLALITTTTSPAHADCTSPAAVEGALNYNTTADQMEFCDGTNWNSMKDTTAASIWLDGGSGKRYYNGGNVGIGADNPSRALHIKGTEGGVLLEETTGGADNEAYLVHFNNSFQVQNRTAAGIFSHTPFSMNITAPANSLYMNSAGNIGIGTDDPQKPLHVRPGGNDANATRIGTMGGDIDALLPGSTFGSLLEGGFQGHNVIGIRDNDTSDSFSIVSGGGNWNTDSTYDTVIFSAEADGKVGIGKSDPQYTLDVNGNFNMSGADLRMYNTARAGGNVHTGRALVHDAGDMLTVNYSGDYTGGVRIGSNTNVQGSVTATAFVGDGSGLTNLPGGGDNLGSGGTTTGQITMNNNNPTLYLQDTDNNAGMIHMNGNLMYFLSADGTNSTTWATNGSHWPMVINMVDDSIAIGGAINMNEGSLNMGTQAITSSAGTIRDGSGGWVRTYGNTGWYNGTYGGGFNMTDTTWVRVYGGKWLYSAAGIRADGGGVRTNQICDTAGGNCVAQSALGGGGGAANCRVRLQTIRDHDIGVFNELTAGNSTSSYSSGNTERCTGYLHTGDDYDNNDGTEISRMRMRVCIQCQ